MTLYMIERVHNFLPNVKDYYAVSDRGEVFSDNLNGQPLKKRITNGGYYRVALYCLDGSCKEYSIHRLVMMAFDPNENSNSLQVNHLDCVRTNNTLENLEWCTPSENQQYAVRLGRTRTANQWGENNASCKLTDAQVKEIFELRKMGWTHQKIADKYNVSRRHIGNILQGKRRQVRS